MRVAGKLGFPAFHTPWRLGAVPVIKSIYWMFPKGVRLSGSYFSLAGGGEMGGDEMKLALAGCSMGAIYVPGDQLWDDFRGAISAGRLVPGRGGKSEARRWWGAFGCGASPGGRLTRNPATMTTWAPRA